MKKIFKVLTVVSLLALFACGKENAKKESKEKVMAVLEQEKQQNEGKVVKIRATDYVIEPNKSDIKNMVLVKKGVTSKKNGNVHHPFPSGPFPAAFPQPSRDTMRIMPRRNPLLYIP